MTDFTLEFYSNTEIRTRYINGDRYWNATDMAKAAGGKKRAKSWKNNKDTIEYMQAVEKDIGLSFEDQILTERGTQGSTWIHEELLIKYSQWLSPEFAVWGSKKIKELLTDGFAALSDTLKDRIEELQLQLLEARQLPQYERTIADWLESWFDGCTREYRLSTGERIDIVNGGTIYEVKRIEDWTRAVGQVLSYKLTYLRDTGEPEVSTALILFGNIDSSSHDLNLIRAVCYNAGITQLHFLGNINNLEDRR